MHVSRKHQYARTHQQVKHTPVREAHTVQAYNQSNKHSI